MKLHRFFDQLLRGKFQSDDTAFFIGNLLGILPYGMQTINDYIRLSKGMRISIAYSRLLEGFLLVVISAFLVLFTVTSDSFNFAVFLLLILPLSLFFFACGVIDFRFFGWSKKYRKS